ncbi:MAG: zinc ribbon domain-containing protein [Candidatus Lokiarchaeia archaeon]
MEISCPNCGANLKVRRDAVIHTCDYCGTAIQVSKMIAKPEASKKEKEKEFVIKDHYIVRCNYPPGQAKNLLVAWISKVPGTPSDFELDVNIHSQKLKFYPLWVGEYAADSQYTGLDNWPEFHSPAYDKTGWFEHVSYYKKEENGRVVREYQIPLPGLKLEKIPEYLREYFVTTTGKEYFDIKHVKNFSGEIIDSTIKFDEAKNQMKQKVLEFQEKEIHKEVKTINTRNDNIDERAVFYIHFPVYEIKYTYKGKDYKALIDGSNGRIIHVETPITTGFRAKTITLGAIHVAIGIILLLFYGLFPFFAIAGGIGIIIIGIIFFAVNFRKKAAEKQL